MAESKVAFAPHDLTQRCVELWRSGRQIWALEGSELARYQSAIKDATIEIDAIRTRLAKGGGYIAAKPVTMIAHDRWAGFHTGLPEMVQCRDGKSGTLANAIKMAMYTKEEIDKEFPGFLDATNPNRLPFNPADDLIFVFKSCHEEIVGQQLTQTFIRDIIHSNACSPLYVQEKAEAAGIGKEEDGTFKGYTRGTRMLVFITPIGEFINTVPELKAEIVPLPDFAALESCAFDVLQPLFDLNKNSKGKRGAHLPTKTDWELLINSGKGMTCGDFEEAVSLAWTRLRDLIEREPLQDGDSRHIPFTTPDVHFFLNIIEKEKAKAVSKIPGVQYIPKEQIVNTTMPGYEAVANWVHTRMKASANKTRKKGINPIRGITLGGAPGLGKSEFSKYLAYLMGKMCIIWNTGESKGSLVGDTEKNTRLVMQYARATESLVLCDDIDKGSIAKSRDYTGDGGTSGNQIQMLLTDMCDATSNVVWVFTFNRVPDLPELMRLGRVDKRYMVVRPNVATRLGILKFHINRLGLKVDDEQGLNALAEATQDWTGAELFHGPIKEEFIQATADDTDVLNVARMMEFTRGFTPMLQQRTFQEDLKAMEEGCAQFTQIGNDNVEPTTVSKPTSAKARRGASA